MTLSKKLIKQSIRASLNPMLCIVCNFLNIADAFQILIHHIAVTKQHLIFTNKEPLQSSFNNETSVAHAVISRLDTSLYTIPTVLNTDGAKRRIIIKLFKTNV